jgi:hypothetical protein
MFQDVMVIVRMKSSENESGRLNSKLQPVLLNERLTQVMT